MEAHKSGKGRVVSQNNYTQSCQIRNGSCYGCGELLWNFVRNWPTKRRSNGAQFKPKNRQKCDWGQRPVTGIWTDSSTVPNFKPENKNFHEIARKISFSNLQEGISSRPSGSSEDYFPPVSYSSEDYLSSASDSSEDYLSSASESSSALHSFEVYSSSVSDSSLFSSSSASHSCIVHSSSDTYKTECQCATSSISQKASVESLQIPIGTDVDFFSQIIEQVSKASQDPAECHKAVQTMHNLSVLLLINSSFSDNLSESDLQSLQSVICNISECLLKSTGVSKSTDVAAFMPDKQLVAANSGKTEKDCHALEEKVSAEVYQSQMANIEVELNLIKSEMRCLKMGLEMEGVKKAHAGTHENGDTEILANRNDVNNGSCPEVNLVMKKNDFDYTYVPFSQERNHFKVISEFW